MQCRRFITTLVLSSSLAFAAQSVELQGDKGYPPYSYLDGKTPKGVYIEILTSAFSKMPDYDLKLKMVAWKKAMKNVQTGKTVGFFPPYYNNERTAWTTFSEPIISENSIVFAKASLLDKAKTFPTDFKGTTLCMNKGWAVQNFGGDDFKNMLKNKSIKVKWGNDNSVCLNQVSKGKADFYINDQLIDTSTYPDIMRGMPTKSNFGYVGFTKKDASYTYMKDLQVKFNTVIKQMKENGEIDAILKKYK